MDKKLTEEITSERDLVSKLVPLNDTDIFNFMDMLQGGTYFNMGMYSPISVSRAYKKTIRIYKVVTMTAIVSGVSYENIGTTKDFRDRTGETAGHAWYNHVPGYENRIGSKKSDPECKYILWDVKKCSGTCVYYYVVDIATGMVTPVSKADIISSDYLTDSEKKKLMPVAVTGYDKETGTMISNQTIWRTTAFDHVFWLSQEGKNPKEYGMKFMESVDLAEAFNDDLFMDGHARVDTDLDAILSGGLAESKRLKEDVADKQLYVATNLDGGELLGAVWANSTEEAYNFFIADGPMIPDQNDNLFVELAEESDFTNEDIEAEFPEVFNGTTGEKRGSLYDRVERDEDAFGGNLTESYRRTVSRGKALNDNDLFVDF